MTTTAIPYEQAECVASTDPAKRDLELICLLCPEGDDPVLCDVESGDGLDVLMSVFSDHWNQTHKKD